ncbi:peptide chain release factor N(5)-glutamine methyltransferase [Flavobacteriaceae bacterium M23B6Z8]
MQLKDLKHIFRKELQALYPKEEIDEFFYRAIEHYYEVKPVYLALNPEFSLKTDEIPVIYKVLNDLKNHKPIQQILGVAPFYGLEFNVNEHVLIPRPETEELVDWIIKDLKKNHSEETELKILDIGTGSGCIAVTLSKNWPNAKVTAFDISEKALDLARQNAKALKADVQFFQRDILKLENLTDEYHVIVSNPPYVRYLEKEKMRPNVLDHEPHLALFVPDDNALVFYQKIGRLAVNNLKPTGALYFEINQYLGKELREELQEIGFGEVEVRCDIYGNDRMIKAKF